MYFLHLKEVVVRSFEDLKLLNKSSETFSLACFHYFVNQWFPFVTANGIIPDTFSCDFFLLKSFHFSYLAFIFLSADNWLFIHSFFPWSSWLYNFHSTKCKHSNSAVGRWTGEGSVTFYPNCAFADSYSPVFSVSEDLASARTFSKLLWKTLSLK